MSVFPYDNVYKRIDVLVSTNTMAYSSNFKSMTKYDESYLEDYECDKGLVFCRTNVLR